jgi:ABC-type glutathione transport system ATPase component
VLRIFHGTEKNKKTVILVTHDMGAVRQYCDTAIMIENGVIVKKGKPDTIAQAYQKLFAMEAAAANKEMVEKAIIQKEDRWGSGRLMVNKSAIIVNEDEILLTVTYKAKSEIDAPILGFTIYDSAGTNIVEGNTQRSRVKTKSMKPDEEVTIKWQIPNIFKDDTYKVTLASCDQSAVDFYDWFNNANSFSIDKGNPTAGIISPNLKVQFNKNGRDHE